MAFNGRWSEATRASGVRTQKTLTSAAGGDTQIRSKANTGNAAGNVRTKAHFPKEFDPFNENSNKVSPNCYTLLARIFPRALTGSVIKRNCVVWRRRSCEKSANIKNLAVKLVRCLGVFRGFAVFHDPFVAFEHSRRLGVDAITRGHAVKTADHFLAFFR